MILRKGMQRKRSSFKPMPVVLADDDRRLNIISKCQICCCVSVNSPGPLVFISAQDPFAAHTWGAGLPLQLV